MLIRRIAVSGESLGVTVSGAVHHEVGGHQEVGELALAQGPGQLLVAQASVLERAGFRGAMNVTGGMDAWSEAGLPTE